MTMLERRAPWKCEPNGSWYARLSCLPFSLFWLKCARILFKKQLQGPPQRVLEAVSKSETFNTSLLSNAIKPSIHDRDLLRVQYDTYLKEMGKCKKYTCYAYPAALCSPIQTNYYLIARLICWYRDNKYNTYILKTKTKERVWHCLDNYYK